MALLLCYWCSDHFSKKANLLNSEGILYIVYIWFAIVYFSKKVFLRMPKRTSEAARRRHIYILMSSQTPWSHFIILFSFACIIDPLKVSKIKEKRRKIWSWKFWASKKYSNPHLLGNSKLFYIIFILFIFLEFWPISIYRENV